jgi:23S rRNA pseudouridine1911/1915/1917 synthase
MRILYQDQTLCLAVKPAGVLSEDAPGGMPELLRAELGGYIGCVHRLDRGVGGVMVYGRKKDTTGKLSAMVAAHDFVKEYLAVVEGVPEQESGTYTDLLFKDSARNKSFVVQRMRKGVKEAVLHYRLLQTVERDGKPWSLVRISLETGRSHQIRVQFSSRKMPLWGDGKYGSKINGDIALWSHRLAFTAPNGKKIDVSALPEGKPWNLFTLPPQEEP